MTMLPYKSSCGGAGLAPPQLARAGIGSCSASPTGFFAGAPSAQAPGWAPPPQTEYQQGYAAGQHAIQLAQWQYVAKTANSEFLFQFANAPPAGHSADWNTRAPSWPLTGVDRRLVLRLCGRGTHGRSGTSPLLRERSGTLRLKAKART